MRREQSQRVTGIQHKSLFVGHFRQIFHRQPILRPVLENGTIPAISNQLMRMLRHRFIQIVGNHQHNCRCLQTLMGIILDIAGKHLILRSETIHINAPVFFKFLCKLRCQYGMMFRFEIAQSVTQGQLFLFPAQNILPLGSMIDFRVIRSGSRQRGRNTLLNSVLKFL